MNGLVESGDIFELSNDLFYPRGLGPGPKLHVKLMH